MTQDELSEAWNDLRNAALGRGVTPNVPEPLAAEVAREYAAWRKAHFSPAPSWTYKWVERYRALLAKVRAAGVKPKRVLPPTPLEDLGVGLQRLGRNVAIGLSLAGAAYVAFELIKASMRRDG